MSDPEVALTLDDAVEEVLNALTGLDLTYDPRLDRYRTITKALNRALRYNALEHEWSYYSDLESVGVAELGQRELLLPPGLRARVINDDAVRLVDDGGVARYWAYFLPRDALHKYPSRRGLWASVTRDTLSFSRALGVDEEGLEIQVPVMREPVMFRLPDPPEDPSDPLPEVPAEVREQEVDFAYPDVICARAAYLYSLTDPVMQPRAQTLEAGYKDLMYQIIERDDRNTDSPFENEFFVPVQNGIHGESIYRPYPLADERR